MLDYSIACSFDTQIEPDLAGCMTLRQLVTLPNFREMVSVLEIRGTAACDTLLSW